MVLIKKMYWFWLKLINKNKIYVYVYLNLKNLILEEYDACFFFKNEDTISQFKKCKTLTKNLALYHLLTNGSSAVNGCRQNESLNSW